MQPTFAQAMQNGNPNYFPPEMQAYMHPAMYQSGYVGFAPPHPYGQHSGNAPNSEQVFQVIFTN